MEPKLLTFREGRLEASTYCVLLFTAERLPMLLRPVCLKYDRMDAIDGRTLPANTWAYPCLSNPLRLSPYGRDRVSVEKVWEHLFDYLPEGWVWVKVPDYPTLMKECGAIASLAKRNRHIAEVGQQLLKTAAHAAFPRKGNL